MVWETWFDCDQFVIAWDLGSKSGGGRGEGVGVGHGSFLISWNEIQRQTQRQRQTRQGTRHKTVDKYKRRQHISRLLQNKRTDVAIVLRYLWKHPQFHPGRWQCYDSHSRSAKKPSTRVRVRVRVHGKCSSTREGRSSSCLIPIPIFVLSDFIVCLVLREDKTRHNTNIRQTPKIYFHLYRGKRADIIECYVQVLQIDKLEAFGKMVRRGR